MSLAEVRRNISSRHAHEHRRSRVEASEPATLGERIADSASAMAWRDDEELGVIYKLQHEQMDILGLLKEAQERQTEMLELLHQASTPPALPQ